MSEIKTVTDKEILSYWDSIKSVRGVAIKLGISWQRVIKSLSSLGIIVNNTHAKITQYHKEGKNVTRSTKGTFKSPFLFYILIHNFLTHFHF